MKILTLLLFLLLLINIECLAQIECISGVNELPLYGEVEKCPQQLEADSLFLERVNQTFANRKGAIQYHIAEGWKYFYQNDYRSAIKRFNQAWLLDSLDAEIYWGFGNLLGLQQKYEESLRFFDKSINLDSTNAKVWESASTSYGNLFYQTKEEKYLKEAIKYLKKSVQLDSLNSTAYAQLTSAYSYYTQLDSARKYLEITDQFDSTLINPELRKRLEIN